MDALNKNWKAIKDLSWNPFPDRQIYFDEYENIFALKGKDNSIIVVAYGHITGDNLFQTGVLNFINDVKSICKIKKWQNITFKMILNISLSKFQYADSLRALPNDIEYFYFDTNRNKHTKPIAQSLQEEINYLARNDRRGEHVNDIESDIMNSLMNGDAEKYGF